MERFGSNLSWIVRTAVETCPLIGTPDVSARRSTTTLAIMTSGGTHLIVLLLFYLVPLAVVGVGLWFVIQTAVLSALRQHAKESRTPSPEAGPESQP